MGNTQAHQTERTRISTNASVEQAKLQNARQQNTEHHAEKMKEIQVNADNKKAEMVNRHRQEMEELQNRKQVDEHDHLMKLKAHELEVSKLEADTKVRLEDVETQKLKVQSNHQVEMLKIEKKSEDGKAVAQVVNKMLEMELSGPEFAYKGLIASSMMRGEAPDLNTLKLIGNHEKMLQEVRLGITLGGESGAGPSPRQQALKQFPGSASDFMGADDDDDENADGSEISQD